MKSETQSVAEGMGGSYEPFAVIVKREGNDKAAVRAAMNYCHTCMRLRPVLGKIPSLTMVFDFIIVFIVDEQSFIID